MRYRIIENATRDIIAAQVWRWYWPFWTELKAYSTLYLNPKSRAVGWCREAIEKHKGNLLDEPEWKVIE